MKLKKGRTPLYYQLEKSLREKMLGGKFSSDVPIPTEEELCREYGVSRTVVRQALKVLEDSGLIIREQGRGTFMTDKRQRPFYYEATGSFESDFRFREDFRIRFISRSIERADDEIASDLRVEQGEKIYCFKGVQALTKDMSRVQYFKWFMPIDIGKDVYETARKETSFFPPLIEALPEPVGQADQIIFSTSATPEISKAIGLTKGDPILVLKGIFTNRSNRPICVSIRYSPPDIFHLIYRLKIQRLK
jgi:DNA-binding GntR family transcriptional regulator